MAMAIGSALGAQGLVLFSLCAVGFAANSLGGPFGTFVATVIAADEHYATYLKNETKAVKITIS